MRLWALRMYAWVKPLSQTLHLYFLTKRSITIEMTRSWNSLRAVRIMKEGFVYMPSIFTRTLEFVFTFNTVAVVLEESCQ